MGLRSGEYFGRNTRRAPTLRIARRTNADYRFGAVVIDAALFVPQSRKRVFIVAVDADAHIPAELVADGPTAIPFVGDHRRLPASA